jgi:hypothetical protein
MSPPDTADATESGTTETEPGCYPRSTVSARSRADGRWCKFAQFPFEGSDRSKNAILKEFNALQ